MGIEKSAVSRRTVAKGAAWSLPVIATAAAAPAASASTAQAGDVVISHACGGATFAGIGLSIPTFTVTAVGQAIDAGSTYTLRGSGLADVRIGAPNDLVQIDVLSSSRVTITIPNAIPAGGNVTFQVLGIASLAVLTRFTLTLANEVGNDNTNKRNDTASGSYTGLALGGGLIGVCGSTNAARRAEESRARRAGLI
ncbi:hypothetical protein [Flexivirga sp. B27]